jgi:hypothetical protein
LIDHDRLFKELLTTFFLEFLDLFLPQVRQYLEADSIEFLDKELFTDVTAGRKHIADIIVKAKFRESDACFVIHVEDQAEPEPDFDKRMFRYYARLYEKFDLPVYPIALFTFDEPHRPEPNAHTVAFPDFIPLRFEFRSIQLNQLNWRDFVQNANPVACALMAKMHIAPEERVKVKVECLRLLATLRLNPAKMQLISGFVDTYLKLNRREAQQFSQELAALSPPEREQTMEIVTSWMEEGIKKGLRKGRTEGRNEGRNEGLRLGEIKIIARRLQRKLGMAEDEIEPRLANLTTAQLEALDEAGDSFATPADLAQWLEHLDKNKVAIDE